MNRKQIKQAFIDSMGVSDYDTAYGYFQNTLLKDIVPNARLYHWNYVFYSYNKPDRAELFKVFGYKDLRNEN
jgi:hypothetical protein